eukprot:gene10415-24421_t
MSVQGEAWDAQLQPLLDRDAPPATTPTVVPQRAWYSSGKIFHAPWNGFHLADIVMPFFLFMVGVSLSLSMRRVLNGAPRRAMYYNGQGLNLSSFRVPGILVRIAWANLVEAITAASINPTKRKKQHLNIFKTFLPHWLVAIGLCAIHMSIMLFWTVPSWSYTPFNRSSGGPANVLPINVTCGIRGIDSNPILAPQCAATRSVDMWILGPAHMFHNPNGPLSRSSYCSSCAPAACECSEKHRCPDGANHGKQKAAFCAGPSDPEGVLPSMSTVLTTWIGVHFGNVLAVFKSEPDRLLKHWSILSVDSSIPYNLQAWIYWGEQQWNLIDSMYYLLCSQPSVDHDLPWTYRLNTLVCKHGMFEGAKEKWAMLVYTLVRIAWWSLVAGYLHRKKWYWAL